MPSQPVQPMRDLEDAETVLRHATDPDYPPLAALTVEEVAAAGLAVRQELLRVRRELAWARAALHRRPGEETVPGAELVLRSHDGGQRAYLNGVPLNDGDSIYLLTEGGWLPGRCYNLGCADDHRADAHFHFTLPGVANDSALSVSVRLPQGARLAWPMEIESAA